MVDKLVKYMTSTKSSELKIDFNKSRSPIEKVYAHSDYKKDWIFIKNFHDRCITAKSRNVGRVGFTDEDSNLLCIKVWLDTLKLFEEGQYLWGQPSEAGIDSDFGERYYFVNAHDKDRALYQTERYSLDSFTYRFPINKEGQFVLILKFSEVYFTHPGGKIFNVNLNGIPIVKNLDIFKEANHVGAALDKYIEFSISKGSILAAGKKVPYGSVVEVEFVKGLADNPKINAIAILTGGEKDLPPLPEMLQLDELDKNQRMEEEHDGMEDKWQNMENIRRQSEDNVDRAAVASGPRTLNPYEQQSDYMGIVLVSLLVLTIPVVFFLRRM